MPQSARFLEWLPRDDLRRDGIAVTRVAELFSEAVQAEPAGYAESAWKRPAIQEELARKEANPPDGKDDYMVQLYLTHVLDGAAGPFIYLDGGQDGGRNRQQVRRTPLRGNYIDEKKFDKRFPAEDVRVRLGRAGTVLFCDTSAFHRGGYSTGERRIMYSATYTPDAAVMERDFELGGAIPEWVSPLARYALR